jgi:hypothetical protein
MSTIVIPFDENDNDREDRSCKIEIMIMRRIKGYPRVPCTVLRPVSIVCCGEDNDMVGET